MASAMCRVLLVLALALFAAGQQPAGQPTCQGPSAQLTFLLQLPTGITPTSNTRVTLLNAISGVPLPGGVNNIQMASLTVCTGSSCGTGNTYLAAISFAYSGVAFIDIATAAERAFKSGSFQRNLDSIQNKQGLTLADLTVITDLCTGATEAGAPLASLAANAPGAAQPACSPGVKLTFILQLPASAKLTAAANRTLVNAVSGLTSVFSGGINNIQAAGTASCTTQICGTGNNYLASVSFSYSAGTSFNNTATAAQRAYSSGAFQNNLNNIQGSLGLQLLGLYQVLDLCSNFVQSGSALIDLAAAAPGSSFLNNGLPTILVGFTVGVPIATKATQATTGRTVANAISGVISGFGGYGVNNPTIVSFVACYTCAVTNPGDLQPLNPTLNTPKQAVQGISATTTYWTLTMTFAYNPGFTFKGLSSLFYTAFGNSLFQANLRNLDKTITLVAITQILDFGTPRSYVTHPPPPPAYLSERVYFNQDQLNGIQSWANSLSYWKYYGYHTLCFNGGGTCINVPFVDVTPDILSLPDNTLQQEAELAVMDNTLYGYAWRLDTLAQRQQLLLAVAASFRAQGMFVNPSDVQLFSRWFNDLGLGPFTARRLLQTEQRLQTCPANHTCSLSFSIAVPPADGYDAIDMALAMYNITSNRILESAIGVITNDSVMIQPKAITVLAASDLTYAPPPGAVAPPPPPMTGKQITAIFRIPKLLNTTELASFKAALAQVMARFGVVPSFISIGSPVAVTGRRLLQTSMSYDYPVTTKVPGTTTPAALTSYLQSADGQSDLSAAITSNGGDFTTSLQSVTESSSDDSTTSTACRSHFGHWCLDNSSVSRGGVIAIIVCVGFFVLLCLVLIPVFLLSAMRRRRSVK